jgi:hypothetical protein
LTFEKRVLHTNPLQQFGSGLEPDPDPTWEFGPVPNTSDDHGDGDGNGHGAGIGDGHYSTRSILTSRLATSLSASKLQQT